MPKSKKQIKTEEEKKTTWRSPVKLPSIAAEDQAMKSLYTPTAEHAQVTEVKEAVNDTASQNLTGKPSKEEFNNSSESSDLNTKTETGKTKKTDHSVAPKHKVKTAPRELNAKSSENDLVKITETAFLRLLRSDKMDFYSLAEILRGSSMALYCVLYSESLSKGENRCQIRQSDLMMRAGINNPATLYKQERWLTVLGLISKSVRPGNHSGASYEVRPLEILPLPNHILNQFDGYLSDSVI